MQKTLPNTEQILDDLNHLTRLKGYKNLFKRSDQSQDNLYKKQLKGNQNEINHLMISLKSLKQKKKRIGQRLLIWLKNNRILSYWKRV